MNKVCCLMAAAMIGCADRSAPPPGEGSLPVERYASIAAELARTTGAPGAIIGVQRGDERWIGAAGSIDREGTVPMRTDVVFRAGSITKMFTAALMMQQLEAGVLHPDDRLARWVPTFPHAADITLDQLLSHTAGVTTAWLDQPDLQAVVTADLSRELTPTEAIALLAEQPPVGAPGAVGMHYSNTDYLLLGEVLTQVTGQDVGTLMRDRVFAAVPLTDTSYRFDLAPGLVSGWYSYRGLAVDMSLLPATSLLSFAGAAGAVHTTPSDLLAFGDALFRSERIVDAASRAHMMTPAEPDAWYAHGLMRYGPPAEGPGGVELTGWGHGGNLPGYWSALVYYPERDLMIVLVINGDGLDGSTPDRHVFDATLAALVDAS